MLFHYPTCSMYGIYLQSLEILGGKSIGKYSMYQMSFAESSGIAMSVDEISSRCCSGRQALSLLGCRWRASSHRAQSQNGFNGDLWGGQLLRYGGFLKQGHSRIIHFSRIYHYKPYIYIYMSTVPPFQETSRSTRGKGCFQPQLAPMDSEPQAKCGRPLAKLVYDLVNGWVYGGYIPYKAFFGD